jgi:hypothetical protein
MARRSNGEGNCQSEKVEGARVLTIDSGDLAMPNGFHLDEASWHERQQIFEAVRFRAQKNNCDVSASQILLVFNTVIHGKQDIEFGRFRSSEKFSILQASQSSITSCLAIVRRQGVPESLIDVFVEEDAHLRTREQEVFSFFECGEGRFARDGRKSL